MFKAPFAPAVGAGKRALLVAEELRLHQLLRDRGHVQCYECVVGTGAMTMQGAGHKLLTSARLAIDQHRDVALGKSANRAEHLLHGRRIADNFCGGVTALVFIDLIVLSALRLGTGDSSDHLLDIKRFWQVLECALFIGAHCAVKVRVRRSDNNGQVGLLRFKLGQQRNTVHARHANITHHHHGLFAGQRLQHIITGLKGAAVEAGSGQSLFHYPPDRAVIVDDPYLVSHRHLRSPWVIAG